MAHLIGFRKHLTLGLGFFDMFRLGGGKGQMPPSYYLHCLLTYRNEIMYRD